MNPNDHPHGGGEGKSPIGRPAPVTPWGKPALGLKTRKTKNRTDKFLSLIHIYLLICFLLLYKIFAYM